MRLRLVDGGMELAALEVCSSAELKSVLISIQHTLGHRLRAAEQLQVHLWHDSVWWNLSDDLSQFFTWILETRAATLDETRAFAADPLSRSDWLFEAARQMKKLLAVVTELQPS